MSKLLIVLFVIALLFIIPAPISILIIIGLIIAGIAK